MRRFWARRDAPLGICRRILPRWDDLCSRRCGDYARRDAQTTRRRQRGNPRRRRRGGRAAGPAGGAGAAALLRRQPRRPAGQPAPRTARSTRRRRTSRCSARSTPPRAAPTTPTRGLIVVPNRGVPQNVQTNNAWVSFINHDGSVHTARWIGVQNPADRASADAAAGAERAVRQRHRQRRALPRRSRRRHRARAIRASPSIRKFDMKTGAPAGEITRRQGRRGSTTSRSPTTAPSTRRMTGVGGQTPDPATLAGVEDHAGRHGLDLRAGRAAAPAERRRPRRAGQHRRRQHGHRRDPDVLAGRRSC